LSANPVYTAPGADETHQAAPGRPSRLLSLNNYHYPRGGSDQVYFQHAQLMQDQGWETACFSMHHPRNLATPWSRHFVDEIEFGHDYSPWRKFVMAGKVVWSFEARRKLSGLLQEFRPDVAHVHCLYHHLSPAVLPLLHDEGIPVVLTAHDLKIACPAYKMLNSGGVCERCREGSLLNVVRHRCVRDSLAASVVVAAETGLHGALQTYRRHVSRIVAPSRFFLEKFVQWGWPREQFRLIPNCVDASRFTPAFEPGAYFLYFGRLAPEKGVGTLLQAAARAGVALKIAGTGPQDAQLREQAAALGGRLSFVGFQSGEALHELVRGARAVVLPSEWYENAPMSVLESFALGKPVIGADIGGIPELIEPHSNGWVFPSGDALALADVLREVAALPAARIKQMGRAARAHVSEHFHRAGYLEATLSLYAELGVRV
jgi:glycosyltransferase involved in cell wall biosynthesis